MMAMEPSTTAPKMSMEEHTRKVINDHPFRSKDNLDKAFTKCRQQMKCVREQKSEFNTKQDKVLCYECPKYHARYDFPQIFHYDDQCLGIPCLWTPNDPHVNGHYWKTHNVTKPCQNYQKKLWIQRICRCHHTTIYSVG